MLRRCARPHADDQSRRVQVCAPAPPRAARRVAPLDMRQSSLAAPAAKSVRSGRGPPRLRPAPPKGRARQVLWFRARVVSCRRRVCVVARPRGVADFASSASVGVRSRSLSASGSVSDLDVGSLPMRARSLDARPRLSPRLRVSVSGSARALRPKPTRLLRGARCPRPPPAPRRPPAVSASSRLQLAVRALSRVTPGSPTDPRVCDVTWRCPQARTTRPEGPACRVCSLRRVPTSGPGAVRLFAPSRPRRRRSAPRPEGRAASRRRRSRGLALHVTARRPRRVPA